MADPSPQNLDALDRLIAAGGPNPATLAPAGAPAGPDVAGLARVAFAVQATAADADGLDADRIWRRVTAGRSAGAATAPAAAPPALPRLIAGLQGRRLWAQSLAAALIVALAATLSLLLLGSDRAEASLLESVGDLTATSAEALRDRRLDAAETAALERRIRALAAILEERPQELRAIPPDDRRALLRALNSVSADLVAAEVDGRDAIRRADTARRLNDSLLQLDGVAAQVATTIGADPPPTGAPGPARPAGARPDGSSPGDRPPDPVRPALDGELDRPAGRDALDDARGGTPPNELERATDRATDDATTPTTERGPSRAETDASGDAAPRLEPIDEAAAGRHRGPGVGPHGRPAGTPASPAPPAGRPPARGGAAGSVRCR